MTFNLDEIALILRAERSSNGELTSVMRACICTLIAAGRSERDVAQLFGVSRGAVRKAVQLWKAHHTFESRPRKGRPEVLTAKEKRYIITLVKRNRDLVKKALIEATGKKVSYSTIKRCLRAHNLRKWKAKKRIPLTKEVAKDRYDFACDWLENIDELLRVCGLKLYLFFKLR